MTNSRGLETLLWSAEVPTRWPSWLSTPGGRVGRFCLDGEPLWGVSVFCALDEIGPASLEGILAGRMATYGLVHTPTVGRLTEAGFDLLPTFSRPHYTIRFASDAEDELARLLTALGPAEPNPYHGGRPRHGRR